MAESILDEENIEPGVKGRWSYPELRRGRRGAQEVGDDAIVKLGEETVLKLKPGGRRLHDDATPLRHPVGGTKVRRT